MYTYCKQYGNKILLRDHKTGIQSIKDHEWELFFQLDKENEDEYTGYKSLYGKKLKRFVYKSIRDAKADIFDSQERMHIYGAKNFAYQYISDIYYGKDVITPELLYIANIDIETGRDEFGYSSATEARCPIISITIENISDGIFYVFGYHSDGYTPKKDNVKYFSFKNETDMLLGFISFFSKKYPDIITGWNVKLYDIPYIVNRVSRIFGENSIAHINRLSPFGIVNEANEKTSYGKILQCYDIIGINTLDYLSLFKKFTYITPENYKLDTVAELLLGKRKVDYSGYKHLQDLYEKNYELFIDYNIGDVFLVHEFDKKLHLFDLVLSVAYKAGINYSDVLSPVTTWDILIYNVIRPMKLIPPHDIIETEKKEQYMGAYVKDPKPSFYKWIISCDLNSLYPHLQMGINISPELRVPDDKLPKELEEIRKSLGSSSDGVERLLDESIDLSALKKYNVTISPNGQFYRSDRDGIIPTILEELYAERKKVKKEMLELKQVMENEGKSTELENVIATKNTMQMALKILMNSEYGALGNKYFRYFDVRNAEAVTSSGQLAIKWVAKHLNIFLNNMLKTKDVDYVIAIDTDSVYLHLDYLVKKFIPNSLDNEKIVNILSRWSSDILEPEIDRIYKELADYINSHKQKMVMKREVIASTGFWTGKKRYALNVHDSEGVRYAKPKPKIMGLESVRSTIPKICRDAIKDCIVIMLNDDEKTLHKFIIDFNDKFLRQEPEMISFTSGTNEIDKWIINGNGIKKGCPIHIRGCIVYNAFLDSITSTDERIQEGDKIKFCRLLTPNKLKSYVVSYPPIPNECIYDEIKTYIDKESQWQGSFFKPVESMAKVIGWNATPINRIEEEGEEY